MDSITEQTIETNHLYSVYLGETLVPYATLTPLQALLPVKQDAESLPADETGIGGVNLGGLERRMRERWQTISRFWESHKQQSSKPNLLGQIDYLHKLTSQIEWIQDPGLRPIRVAYSSSGTPTAGLVQNDYSVVDKTLFWITCKTTDEANYLLAIINSDTLSDAVAPLMPKGQFGARHLLKHLWKLPIPEYDPNIALHRRIAKAGAAAAQKAADKLAQLRAEYQQRHETWAANGRRGREPMLTVTIARRELRGWLRASPEGAAVEQAVSRLLAGGNG